MAVPQGLCQLCSKVFQSGVITLEELLEAQSEASGFANGSAPGSAKSLVASKPGRLCMITNKKLDNVDKDGFILI